MKQNSRIEKVGAALRRQRSGGRTLIRYEGGPTWFNGQVVEPLSSDLVVEIVYQAPVGAQNVTHMVWDYEDNLMTSDSDGQPHNLIHDAGDK